MCGVHGYWPGNQAFSCFLFHPTLSTLGDVRAMWTLRGTCGGVEHNSAFILFSWLNEQQLQQCCTQQALLSPDHRSGSYSRLVNAAGPHQCLAPRPICVEQLIATLLHSYPPKQKCRPPINRGPMLASKLCLEIVWECSLWCRSTLYQNCMICTAKLQCLAASPCAICWYRCTPNVPVSFVFLDLEFP